MERIKVGIAMSGGVDSTAAALMLKNQYDVTGFFMQLAQPDRERQIARVNEIADRIGIHLHVIDLTDSFDKHVLQYFSQSYLSGSTPNPCIVCNRKIKFGLFLETLIDNGMDMMATGHYARIVQSPQGYHLYKGKDRHKDQSYFLSRLEQKQLSRLLFPLGGLQKEDAYLLAEENGHTGFRGKESQDVCFLDKTSVAQFLQKKEQQTLSPGNITDIAGRILGKHNGAAHYTIGQRKGLGISAPHPVYVVGIDTAANTVVVGTEKELFKSQIIIRDLHWLANCPPKQLDSFLVKIRSTHKGSMAKLINGEEGNWILHFDTPQRAITPGQYAVLYHNDEVMGSGVIVE
ncbi:MAG: tRNA 2-thiouridine(34) synthase MnmA [Desulfopila sp.]|nr:tRNA 2-thiouridine(34) synthase MnmA [Desulfopila sp.]